MKDELLSISLVMLGFLIGVSFVIIYTYVEYGFLIT